LLSAASCYLGRHHSTNFISGSCCGMTQAGMRWSVEIWLDQDVFWVQKSVKLIKPLVSDLEMEFVS
jgi:hypothetical protein